MAKNIKKSVKYLIIAAGIIILLPTVLYSFLRLPAIQTILVNRITSYLSGEIQSAISIGRIEYSFFNRLRLDKFLIMDYNNDTLIYSGKVTAVIKNIDFSNRVFTLGHVELTDPLAAFITDSSGTMNIKWFLSRITTPGDTTGKKKSTLDINKIDFRNARFSLINKPGEKTNTIIDFNNLSLSEINGTLENFRIFNDTVTFKVYDLSFLESEGFRVNRFNSEVLLSGKNILFNSALVNCDSSVLNFDHVRLYGDSTASFSRFIEEIKLDIILDESVVSTSDLEYFVPAVKGMNEKAFLSGRVAGTISELRGRNIKLSYGESTVLNCDFDFSGLPEIDNTFMYLGINNLKISAKDISVIKIENNDTLKIPDFIYKLGAISFNGSFTGFTTDFVAYGKLRTTEGTVSTDISFRPEESGMYKIKGLLTGNGINLGKITGKPDLLGNASFTTNVDGFAYSDKKFRCDIAGVVDSIELNHYKYRNVKLNGIISEKAWDGNINISEENIKLDLLGIFNFSSDLPEMDFTLNLANASLFNLNLDRNDTSSNISALLTANLRGNNIDNLDGEIKLLNSRIRKYGKVLDLYNFSVKTFTENGLPAIDLRTDFADADIRGYYNFSGLGTLIQHSFSSLIPSGILTSLTQSAYVNDFVFSIRFKDTEQINNLLNTGILLSDNSFLNGEVICDSLLRIKGEAKSVNVRNNILEDLVIDAELQNDNLRVKLNSSALKSFGQSEFKGLSAALAFKPDSFDFSVNWDNKDKILSLGNIMARGAYSKNKITGGKPLLRIDLDSTDIYNRNQLWRISKSVILLDSNSININRLYISNNERSYLLKGTISENPDDTMKIQFSNIDISPLNYFLERKIQSDEISLGISGKMNGSVLLTDVYRNFLFESNLRINDFSMLHSKYGDLSILSVWNPEKKVADIRAGNNLSGKKMLDIAGYYDPESKRLDLTGNADKLPLDALNPILKVFASGITGTASGRVNFSGPTDQLVLKGALFAENASMKIDYLQTRYRLNDSIRFDKNSIIFRNVKIEDERGNTAALNGTVTHKYFRDYGADLAINTNECMALNTKPKDNELFYGTAYASGVATIKSGPSSLSFDISAKTGRNTRISIPLNTSETVSDYSFITFVNKDSSENDAVSSSTVTPAENTTLGFDMDFDLEITPDAEVRLIFDEKVGDEITGTGSGNLNIRLDQKGNFGIYGDYIIEDGTYLFTLKNILNKKFRVENGGKISFNGDIDNAEIDMKAMYTANTSLSNILQDDRYSERSEVECQILLSGNLFNPVVKLDIYLPKADESTRAYLRNVITTEEELSRQFLYLLVMNSFYSVNSTYGSSLVTSTTQTGTSAMAVTTTEMVSNQLSNWLSQISNDFDVGFNYRPGYTDINSNQLELAFSTQLLNDKVTINGNFDVRGQAGAASNTDNLTGDFDVEYKITEKIRFKVFNRFNNPYSGKQSDYTQGFGFFYRQDFDKFADLLRKKEKTDMKKEDEAVLQEE